MKKLLALFSLLFTTLSSSGQAPDYDKYFNSLKPSFESKKYFVWAGDTLNRTDHKGGKLGLWIEFDIRYSIAELQTLDFDQESEPISSVDTVNRYYQIKGIGKYKNNRKQGRWILYYKHRNPKAELTFNNGRITGQAKLYYNKDPQIIKYFGDINENDSTTIFKYFNIKGGFIKNIEFNVYKLLEVIK
ncbi:MAG: hypothetical protein OCD76_12760 [Reichenbachiella sp.]